MTLSRFLTALAVLEISLQAMTVFAQQAPQPTGYSAQSAVTVKRLPQVWNELTAPMPRENRPHIELTGYLKAPSPDPIPEIRLDPLATGNVDSVLESFPIDEAEFAEAEMVELETLAEPKYTSGLRDFWGYRYQMSSIDWTIGNGNQFGMFSLNGDHYQRAGVKSGFNVGLDFNFVSGPAQTEMPPRLYDFSIAYQCRQDFGWFAYDMAASVMASSDFEGSSRKGIRYPGHAVGFLRINPSAQLVFGVDYLDWGNIKLLPVAGLIWIPRDDLRLELVFPRPRATFALPMFLQPTCVTSPPSCEETPSSFSVNVGPKHVQERRLYIAGDLGGGTWAVERGRIYDDLATYRDLRLSVGLECVEKSGSRSAIEVSYLFERRLEFTSGNGDMKLDDTVMLRWIGSY